MVPSCCTTAILSAEATFVVLQILHTNDLCKGENVFFAGTVPEVSIVICLMPMLAVAVGLQHVAAAYCPPFSSTSDKKS